MNGSAPDQSAAKSLPRRGIAALWILLAALVCLLLLPRLVHQSMFFDGTIYASIARNMAEGIGSAWSPHFSKTLFPVFAEHPPLMMWLQAKGFMVFGDTIAVEKGFSLLTFVIAGLLLFKIWMRLHDGDPEMQSAAPLALLMALVAGRVNWTFANGMLENLLSVFTLAAVLFVVTAYGERRGGVASRVALIVCAGLAISLALLTKGPVGLFPLATPALYWLAFRKPSFRAALVDSVALFVVIALFFLVLWLFEAPRENIQRYLTVQLLPSLSGERGHGSAWWAFRALLRGHAYPLAIMVVMLAIAWRRGDSMDPALQRDRLRRAVFLLLLGCSASLPIFLSPRVGDFYFTPSFAYFAAGMCVFCAPALLKVMRRMGARWQSLLWFSSIGVLIASFVVVGLNFGRPGEDRRTIEDASRIAHVVCGAGIACGSTISACGAVVEDWALHAYMQRYYKVSIARTSAATAEYMVADDRCRLDPAYKDTGADVAPRRLLRRSP